jgi:plastocyanin
VTRSRRIITLAALAATATAVAGEPGAAAGAGRRTVVLQNIAFTPSKLTVARGTTVVFRWRDGDTPHNVRSRGLPRLRGAGDRTTGTHPVRFAKPGTYRYECTIHPGMTGRVVVR